MRRHVRIRHDRTSFTHAGRRFQICPLGPPLRRWCHVQGEADLVTGVHGGTVRGWANPRPQPVRPESVAAAGSYSAGGNSDYYGFSFFVSPGGTSILNISVDSDVTCSPAGSFPGSNQIVIPRVAIAPNGTFVGSTTDNGAFDNADAKFTYFFAGHFRPATSAGPPTAAGTLRQDIVFAANGTRETCTSNLESWAATHDPQPAPARTVAVPGSYSAGGNSDYYGFSFFVSPGGAKLVNVAVDAGLECTPAGSFPRFNEIVIPNVAIAANGSFSGTATQHGVFDNANAEFTYSFAGYFEGATPAGPETLAGTLSEGVVFAANGTTETCTSNLQPWSATHDPQPAPARTVVVPGSYSAGGNNDYYGFTFSVSSGSLTNISVDAGVECTPAGSFPGFNRIRDPERGNRGQRLVQRDGNPAWRLRQRQRRVHLLVRRVLRGGDSRRDPDGSGDLTRRHSVLRQRDGRGVHVKPATLVGDSHFLGQLKLNITVATAPGNQTGAVALFPEPREQHRTERGARRAALAVIPGVCLTGTCLTTRTG